MERKIVGINLEKKAETIVNTKVEVTETIEVKVT